MVIFNSYMLNYRRVISPRLRTSATPQEAYAWKKALGLCAFADGSEITSGGESGSLGWLSRENWNRKTPS